jgi:RNA polymerase sigma-70 factor, ECF subfamily
MPRESPAGHPKGSLEQFLSAHSRVIEWLHAKAQASRWKLTTARFGRALYSSAEGRFRGTNPSAAEVTAYLESLHVEDLALACACSDGVEPAWDYFIEQYQQGMYAAARAIMRRWLAGAREEQARDLADSLYADLYGLEQREAGRRCLFDYFHGRSKLATWLHAVLAQRQVDALRASQRTAPLEEEQARADARGLRPGSDASGVPLDPERGRYVVLLQRALLEALAALRPRDRLRLAYYYTQELTLAKIGRILGEHEATVSRNLDRTRRELREQVEQILRAGQISADGAPAAGGLSEAQIRLCFDYALEEWPFDLTRALGVPDGSGGARSGGPRETKMAED